MCVGCTCRCGNLIRAVLACIICFLKMIFIFICGHMSEIYHNQEVHEKSTKMCLPLPDEGQYFRPAQEKGVRRREMVNHQNHKFEHDFCGNRGLEKNMFWIDGTAKNRRF